jgi:hypothetical protein
MKKSEKTTPKPTRHLPRRRQVWQAKHKQGTKMVSHFKPQGIRDGNLKAKTFTPQVFNLSPITNNSNISILMRQPKPTPNYRPIIHQTLNFKAPCQTIFKMPISSRKNPLQTPNKPICQIDKAPPHRALQTPLAPSVTTRGQ